jgi:ABC-type ATPase with predicted acetyltransferase domain
MSETETVYGRWKCEGCGAVCNSEVQPAVCEFCGSAEITDLGPDSTEVVNH